MIIADTGLWLALADRKDRHHASAAAQLKTIREPLVTTWPVLAETCHLLLHRLGVDAQLRFVRALRSGVSRVWEVPPDAWPRVEALMKKYADLPMDLADASLVLLAEHLGHGRILSTDTRDFRTHRFKSRKPFRNLLEH